MSWRQAAELARQEADAAREEARHLCGEDSPRADAFRSYLQRYPDQAALVAWTRRRKAQHLDEFAGECERLKDTDITVLERRRKR